MLDGDLFNTILDFFNQFNTGLNELTLSQIGALSHLLASIFILLCLFSIIVIIYSDFLLNYLNIESKFPVLGKYIKIRKKFQRFYLFVNFLLIIITLLALIFVNLHLLSMLKKKIYFFFFPLFIKLIREIFHI